MENLTGRQLGPYRVVAPLGEGGMAAVYKAYQAGMDRYVALKILPREFAKDAGFVARFSREARLIAKLEHPNILPVYDFGDAEGFTYLAMRFVQGGTLADLMERGTLQVSHICNIVSQVGTALDYAHSSGIFHRDVKPSNILIDPAGNCLLTDFGIAKMVESSIQLTQTGGILGTPAYMSPEQGLGRPLDGRSDIYALGVVLYELVTGRLPFQAETPVAVVLKHIQDPLPPPRLYNATLPEALERVILKAMAKDTGDRYATAGDMVKALRAVPGGLGEGSALAEVLPKFAPAPMAVREESTRAAEERERERQERERERQERERERQEQERERQERAKREEEESMRASVQIHMYRRSLARKNLAYALFIGWPLMGIITLGMMQNIPGPDGKKVELDPASIAALLLIYSSFGLLGLLPLRKSKRLYQELQDKVAKEGNYYCCACGTPKKKYYWVHFIFLPLLPWGLIALLFPLKKCQTCGRPYSTITRLPADLDAKASAGSG